MQMYTQHTCTFLWLNKEKKKKKKKKKKTLKYPYTFFCFSFWKNFLGIQNEFESATVNVLSVFESLRFYCILSFLISSHFRTFRIRISSYKRPLASYGLPPLLTPPYAPPPSPPPPHTHNHDVWKFLLAYMALRVFHFLRNPLEMGI